MTRLTAFVTAFACLTLTTDRLVAQPPGLAVYGPRVGPWFGPNYGPGIWGGGWGGGWGWGYGGEWMVFPGVPLFGIAGIDPYDLPTTTVGPTPGAFSRTGGYGIGAGLYGAGKDLPTVLPRGNGPLFATPDVRRRYDAIKANPQIAFDRVYWDRMRMYR